MNTFFDKVLDVLRQDNRFFSEDGELLRNAVYDENLTNENSIFHTSFKNGFYFIIT